MSQETDRIAREVNRISDVIDGDLRIAVLTYEESIKVALDGRPFDHVDLLTDSSVNIAFNDGTQMVIDSASWSATSFIKEGRAKVPKGWEADKPHPPLSDITLRRRSHPRAGMYGEFEEVDVLGTWEGMQVRIAQFRATCSLGSLSLTASLSKPSV